MTVIMQDHAEEARAYGYALHIPGCMQLCEARCPCGLRCVYVLLFAFFYLHQPLPTLARYALLVGSDVRHVQWLRVLWTDWHLL